MPTCAIIQGILKWTETHLFPTEYTNYVQFRIIIKGVPRERISTTRLKVDCS